MRHSLTGPIIAPDGKPTSAVVLLHGYGANGDDLIGLGQYWRDTLPDTVFLAPNAPEELPMPAMGGLQWFGLTTRDADEFWRGVNQAGPILDEFLDEVLRTYNLTADRMALAGFSQGTMLALHAGLRRRDSVAAIVGFSGRLAGATHLSTELAACPPIQLIHGDVDDVIPVGAIHEAREALRESGLNVEWHVRPGLGHGIDEVGLQLAGKFLRQHLANAAS